MFEKRMCYESRLLSRDKQYRFSILDEENPRRSGLTLMRKPYEF